MNTRFKLAAALGLALATGFAGVASAQTAAPTDTAPAITQPAPAATPAKAPMTKSVSHKVRRMHVGHRSTRHVKVARHLRHAKLAHKAGVTTHAKIARSALVRKHAKLSSVRKHVAKANTAFVRHAMNRTAKTTVIR